MRTFDWDDFLTHHRLFSSFDKREITWLLRGDVSQERMNQKDEVLFSEGEGDDTLFLIGSGAVQIILPGKTAYDMALHRHGEGCRRLYGVGGEGTGVSRTAGGPYGYCL